MVLSLLCRRCKDMEVAQKEVSRVKSELDLKDDERNACTDPHYHFVCQECGAVIDLDMAPIDEKLNEIASENFPGEITQNVVYFKGICKNCLKKH